MTISPRGVVRSTSCLFYGGLFGVGGSNGAIFGFAKSKMAARPPSWKIQMAISRRHIIRFTPCLVLWWGFRGQRIEWRGSIEGLQSQRYNYNYNYYCYIIIGKMLLPSVSSSAVVLCWDKVVLMSVCSPSSLVYLALIPRCRRRMCLIMRLG